ncbi:MAG: DNA cytosine methyltransferase [Phycisphaerales bacterium JB040]
MARKRPLRFIDLFAGLGGFHVGLSRLGHRCVLASESDSELRRVYLANHGLMPDADVRSLRSSEIPNHDILCAGFPCQPFSKAGEQLGLHCDRDGDLFHHIVRILEEKAPRWFILENVANLRQHGGGNTYRLMRDELEAIGYEVDELVLSPHEFDIPQIRDRLFIVGSTSGLDKFRWPDPSDSVPHISSVLDRQPSDAKQLPDHYERCIDVWQEFLDRIPSNSSLPSFPIWSFEFGATYKFTDDPPLSRSARALARERGSFGQPLSGLTSVERESRIPSYARARAPFPKWKRTFIQQNRDFYEAHKRELKPWLPKLQGFAPSLQKLEWNCKGEVRDLRRHVLQFRASGLRVKRANWAPALIAMTTTQVPVVSWESRYMTVTECARLQGLGSLSLGSLSGSRAFRAIGNAVSADLVELIARNLVGEVLRDSSMTPCDILATA